MYSLYHRHAKTGGFIELALENFLEDSLGLFFLGLHVVSIQCGKLGGR